MQKSFCVVLAAALIALGIWGWQTLFPSPEKKIRTQLARLAKTVSYDAKMGTIPRALKAQQVPDYFTPEAVINLQVRGFDEHTWNGREEIRETAMAALLRLGGVKVEFLDINVKLGADRQTAIANLTGKAMLRSESDFWVQEFNFRFKKVNGQWLIDRIETVRTLSQNTGDRKARACPTDFHTAAPARRSGQATQLETCLNSIESKCG